MALSDDLDAMARAQGQREATARETPAPRRRGRHRAPTTPFWALRRARHSRAELTERTREP